MNKISINLLPEEFTAEQVKKAKFYKVQATGVVLILVMFFLASITVSLRILQSHNISQARAQVGSSEQKVLDLKDRQVQLILLKDRLVQIDKFQGPSKQTTLYNLTTSLLPPSLSVSSISVDKSGGVTIIGVSSSAQTLDDLVLKLTQKETNEDKIQSVSVDTLSRGREGVYRVSLKITPK